MFNSKKKKHSIQDFNLAKPKSFAPLEDNEMAFDSSFTLTKKNTSSGKSKQHPKLNNNCMVMTARLEKLNSKSVSKTGTHHQQAHSTAFEDVIAHTLAKYAEGSKVVRNGPEMKGSFLANGVQHQKVKNNQTTFLQNAASKAEASLQSENKQPTPLNCRDSISIGGTSVRRMTTSERQTVTEDELQVLIKEYEKKNFIIKSKSSYNKYEMLRIFKKFDLDHKAQQTRIKELQKKLENSTKDRESLEKSLEEVQKSNGDLKLKLDLVVDSEQGEHLKTRLEQSNQVLKQLSVTLGFFLSLYKELEDLEELNFLNPGQAMNLKDTLGRYELSSVFADIDQIAADIQQNSAAMLKSKDEKGQSDAANAQEGTKAIPKEDEKAVQKNSNSKLKRSKSQINYRDFRKGPRQVHDTSTLEPQKTMDATIKLRKESRCYRHPVCYSKPEKCHKKEIDELTKQYVKMRQEIKDKDVLIQDLNKKLSNEGDAEQLIAKISHLTEELGLQSNEKVQLQNDYEALKSQKSKILGEDEARVMESNKMQGKLADLEREVVEVRGLLGNEDKFVQLESTLQQLSGLIVSHQKEIKLGDSQLRQLIKVFNYGEQLQRLVRVMGVQFEESGQALDMILNAITHFKKNNTDDSAKFTQLDDEIRDLVLKREQRLMQFERQYKRHLPKQEPHLPDSASHLQCDTIDCFNETFNFQQPLRDTSNFSITDANSNDRSRSTERSKTLGSGNGRKNQSQIRKLREDVNKQVEENRKLKTALQKLQVSQTMLLKRGVSQSFDPQFSPIHFADKELEGEEEEDELLI